MLRVVGCGHSTAVFEGLPAMRTLSKSERSWRRTFAVLQALSERDWTRTELLREARRRLAGDGADPFLSDEGAEIFALRRDLDRLRRVFGCKIVFRRKSGAYHLQERPLLLPLTEDEARGLAILRDLTDRTSPVLSDVATLLQKILQSSSSGDRGAADRASALQLSLSLADDLGARLQDIRTLMRAIELHRQVDLEYFSPQSRRARQRTMEPAELTIKDLHLYLRAYDLDRSEVREFRVDRVTPRSVRLLPNKARHAPAPRRWTIKFRVMPELARYGITRNLESQREEAQADGSVVVTGVIRSLFDGEWLLLRYGPGVECLEPPQLRARLADHARRMAEMYEVAEGTRPQAGSWRRRASDRQDRESEAGTSRAAVGG